MRPELSRVRSHCTRAADDGSFTLKARLKVARGVLRTPECRGDGARLDVECCQDGPSSQPLRQLMRIVFSSDGPRTPAA